MITIRPAGELTPIDHAQIVAKFWNRLGVWSRRTSQPPRAPKGSAASGGFYCVLVREAEPNRAGHGIGEHFHALVHVPAGHLGLLAEALARWHPGDNVHLKPANQKVEFTAARKIKSAIGYLTKQRTQQAWWGTAYRRKPGGIVLGKRFRMTANLRARQIDLPQRQVA